MIEATPEAEIAYLKLLTAEAAEQVLDLRTAISNALACTPSVRDGQIVYDCGDPWEILRDAIGE